MKLVGRPIHRENKADATVMVAELHDVPAKTLIGNLISQKRQVRHKRPQRRKQAEQNQDQAGAEREQEADKDNNWRNITENAIPASTASP